MQVTSDLWEYSMYRILSVAHPFKCRIPTIPFQNAHHAGPLYDKIYNLEIDGVIIKGFLSGEEIRYFKKRLSEYSPRVTYKTTFGYTIGQTISNSDRTEYFSKNVLLENDFEQMLSFPFNARLQYLLANLSLCGKAEPARLDPEHVFCPATFRIMYPNQGALSIHSEKMINRMHPLNQELLSSITFNREEISYFIILQNSESGGDLILFDQYCDDDSYDISRGLPTWKEVYTRRVKIIRIEEGDMILFNGGRIWHRIGDIRGEKPRITLAGFSDFNKTKDTIFYWS